MSRRSIRLAAAALAGLVLAAGAAVVTAESASAGYPITIAR